MLKRAIILNSQMDRNTTPHTALFKRLTFWVLATMLLCASDLTAAVGLGDITVQSQLGQPLQARVALFGDDVQIAPPCIHARFVSDALDQPVAARITVEKLGDALRLTTRQSLSEPALFLRLTLDCAGQYYRRDYTLLLDIPTQLPIVTQGSSHEAAANQTASSQIPAENLPQPASNSNQHISLSGSAKTHGRRHADSSRQPHPPSLRTASSHPPRHHAGTTPMLSVSEEAATPYHGLVLHLSTELPETPVRGDRQAIEQQSAQNLAALKAAEIHLQALLGQQSLAVTPDPQLQAKQQQIDKLNQELLRLKQENKPRQTLPLPIAGLQTSAQGHASPWMIGLALLAGTELIALLIMLQLLQKRKQDLFSKMLQAPALEPMPAETTIPVYMPPVPTSPPAITETETEAVSIHATASEPSASLVARAIQPHHDANAEIGLFEVEEISDVTQEAEFWISVNNLDKAIEILETQTQQETQDSPAPWLYLLDLYRMSQNEEKYRQLQQGFAALFNAHTPDYNDDPAMTEERHLEDYPHITKKINELWNDDSIITFLRSLLLVDPTRDKRAGFDLSVYREILLLIGIAQEIVNRRAEPKTERMHPLDDLDLDIEDIHDVFRVVK